MGETTVGFVGLGVMGAAMAGHLLKSRGKLLVYNRTRAKADPLVAEGAKFASLEAMGAECDAILLCVTRSEDVQECLAELKPKKGTLIVDHSTIAPSGAVAIHNALIDRGVRFVDAPVTGGSVGAKNGALTIFMGGDTADVEEAVTLAAPYTKRTARMGDAGSGQMAKMVNQIAVAGTLLSLCESMAFAKKAGLDLALVKDLVGSGAGGSWCYEVYGAKILAEDWTPGFSVDNQIKDLVYCQEAAQQVGAIAPATELTTRLLERVAAAGDGALTTAALYREYLNSAG